MSKRKKSLNERAIPDQSGTFLTTAVPLGMLVGLGLIVVIALVAYYPSINGGFIWDDYLLLVDNALIKAPDGLQRIWCTAQAIDFWPATNTSFWIEWRLWELNSTGYHVTNLILHVLESLLVWIILRKLSVPGAFLAAVIFAVHPVNVESVAWIAQRKNTMAMLFFLLSILWYVKFLELARLRLAAKPPAIHHPMLSFSSFILHPSSFHIWYWLSLGAFLLAMLSKGSVAMLPVLLLGIVWWLRPVTWRDVARIAPFFAIAAILAAVNVEFQTHATEKVVRAIGFTDRLLGAGGVVWFYLYKALLPVDLAFVYHQWNINSGTIRWWLPLLAAIALTAVLWWYRKEWSRDVLFAWGIFCVSLVPVMGFTDVAFMQYSLVADRYQHIAIIAVIAFASAVWSVWLRSLQRSNATGGNSHRRRGCNRVCVLNECDKTRLYRDAMTLYQATLEKNPDCIMAQYNYANALVNTNRPQDAVEHYKQAIRLEPDFVMAHYGLGNTLVKTGRAEEAVGHFQEFLRLKPGHAEVHNSLGNAFAQLKRPEEAIEQFEKALAINPASAQAHLNLGNILLQKGRPEDAVEHFRQVLRLQPQRAEAYAILGIALAQTGRLTEAIESFQQALRKNPNDPETHKNLGNALMLSGRHQEAIDHFKQALQIKPDYIGAYNLMALAYANMNQTARCHSHGPKSLGSCPCSKTTGPGQTN